MNKELIEWKIEQKKILMETSLKNVEKSVKYTCI